MIKILCQNSKHINFDSFPDPCYSQSYWQPTLLGFSGIVVAAYPISTTSSTKQDITAETLQSSAAIELQATATAITGQQLSVGPVVVVEKFITVSIAAELPSMHYSV